MSECKKQFNHINQRIECPICKTYADTDDDLECKTPAEIGLAFFKELQRENRLSKLKEEKES